MSFSLFYARAQTGISFFILMSAIACTTVPQKDVKPRQPPLIGATPSAPQSGHASVPPVGVQKPVEPAALEIPKTEDISVGLILGPGGAKALAEIGVLRELERAQIPVRAVIGIEWGGLVGGLFSSHGRANDVEWQIAKLKQEDLPRSAIFGSRITPVGIDKVSGFLDQAAAGRKTHEGRIPFSCPFMDLETDQIQWADQGALKDAIASCLPLPPVFESKSRVSTPFSVRGAVRWLNAHGIQKIILVNVLPSGAITTEKNYSSDQALELFWREIRNQMRLDKDGIDWTIDVPTKGFSFHEVENMRALISLGSKVAAPQMPALRKKLGL